MKSEIQIPSDDGQIQIKKLHIGQFNNQHIVFHLALTSVGELR